MSERGNGAQDGVTFRHDGSGSDEATWRGWRRLEHLPPLDWDGLDHVVPEGDPVMRTVSRLTHPAPPAEMEPAARG